MNRREFLTASAGAAAGTAVATGTGAAAEASPTATAGGNESTGGDSSSSGGNQLPDFGGYLDDAKGGTVEDLRGQSEVTVEVGGGDGFAFLPTGIWIDPGTTVTFEWVSDNHNIKPDGQPSEASWEGTAGGQFETYDEGHTYSFTFETNGIYKYVCVPHEGQGMKGAMAVGDDVPTVTVEPTPAAGGGSQEVNPEHMGVPFQAHYVGIATLLGITVSLVFTFFFLKYGTSPHTGHPEER